MNTIKDKIRNFAEETMGGDYAGFDERPGDPSSFTVGAYEDIEKSGWRGRWHSAIRNFIVSEFPEVRCVCVNPFPRGKIVTYSVTIA